MCRSFLFLISLLLFLQNVQAQNAKLANERLTLLGKIWGFVKYYHPTLSQENKDWDSVLLHTIPLVKASQSDAEFNTAIQGMLSAAGWQKVPKPKKKFELAHWIEADKMLNDENKNELIYLRENLKTKENNFVKFEFQPFPQIVITEKEHLDLTSPDEKYRLLILFRYWNFVKYFYPNYAEIEKLWEEMLVKFTPRMYFSSSDDDYQRVLLELHRCLAENYTPNYCFEEDRLFGKYLLPFKMEIFDNQVVVSSFLTDSMEKTSPIQIGDMIVSINDRTINALEKEQNRLAAGSNAQMRRQNMWNDHISRQTARGCFISVKRGADTLKLEVKNLAYHDLYQYYQQKRSHAPFAQTEAWTVLKSEIGYMNVQYLNAENLPQAVKSLEKTKNLLIDLRGTPMNISDAFLSYFTHDVQTATKIEYADAKNIGKWLSADISNFEREPNANAPIYQGEIFLLINQNTVGLAERMTLALKTVPNAAIIGTPSAGNPILPSLLKFPGNYWLGFTATRAFTPSGQQISQKGIVPDVQVPISLEDLQSHKDVILERAIEWVRTGK
ncbi:MAG: S41 family peptidase [Bacteroidia bacterium]